MKMRNRFVVMAATIAAASACALFSQRAMAVTVFDDVFSPVDGNTVDQSPAAPTATSASYEIAGSSTNNASASITTGDFNIKAPTTSSVFTEAMAQFTTSPLQLATIGDYADISVTFVDTLGILYTGQTGGQLCLGLYNSENTMPLQGLMLLNSSTLANGGAKGWHGYYGKFTTSGANYIIGREPQTAANSSVQDLLFNNASNGIAFGSPLGNVLGTAPSATGKTLTVGATYTDELRITLTGAGTLDVTNTLFNSVGGVLWSMDGTTNGLSGAESLDAMAFGWRYASGPQTNSSVDISEIKVTSDIPEPSTILLVGAGFGLALGLIRRRRS